MTVAIVFTCCIRRSSLPGRSHSFVCNPQLGLHLLNAFVSAAHNSVLRSFCEFDDVIDAAQATGSDGKQSLERDGTHAVVVRGPDMQRIVYRVCKTAADIKRMWDVQRTEAASRGTWMHLQIECRPELDRSWMMHWDAPCLVTTGMGHRAGERSNSGAYV